MKKIIWALIIGGVFIGLAYTQTPGRNQSLLVITTSFNLVRDKLEVHVNGNKEHILDNGSTATIIINNGEHTLTFVSLNGYTRNLTPLTTKNLQINANSQRIVIEVKVNSARTISANITSQTQLNPNATSGNSSGNFLEDAVNKICESLIFDLPKNNTIAVLSVSSRERNIATYVIEEIEYQLVNSREFRIVDRNTLDKIRTEQNFQLSGDVDDNSAVSIGRMLGASIVITGTISGSGTSQRLTIKALDVQTAQIITMAREAF
jgi:TolB-like protein